MKLIAELLSLQDPAQPHTLLTRVIISLIIVGVSLVYAGFFGVLGSVAVYLIGVELMNLNIRWMFAPVGLALILGTKCAIGHLLTYWRDPGP